MKYILRFFRKEEAATAVEYAVMLALVLMVVIAAISSLGTKTSGLWGAIVAALRSAGVLP